MDGARLRYPDFGRYGFRGGGFSWTTDYPRSDRHLLEGVRRLTRIDSRSVEQVVDLDGEDDIYNWPMLYAVERGHWELTDEQAAQLRDFLLRGGFLMVDDFHGTREWDVHQQLLNKEFPYRAIVDLENSSELFSYHRKIFRSRFQVPGAQYWRSGRTYEYDGFNAKWASILDDKGRVMVAICHNMDLGDAWEWSDDPGSPEKMARRSAYRIAMNYFTYDQHINGKAI